MAPRLNPVPPPVKYPYVGGVRYALWKWADIPSAIFPEQVYLRRLRVIQCPLFAIYVHWIFQADGDRDPHNHPMNFWSFVLKGGYREVRYTYTGRSLGYRTRRRFSLARTAMNQYHRIIRLFRKPTVTLLFVGKRSQSWNFMLPDGTKVDYREYK